MDTPDILDCNEAKTFWVGWSAGHVRVGVGSRVGYNQFMDWRDPNPKAIIQAFFDTGDNAEGVFEILNAEGKPKFLL